MNSISLSRLRQPDADQIGVAASVLCAIHCALAPVLLLLMPAFGRIWAHPASHTIVALLVVPLAIFAIKRGFRRHRRAWVVGVAAIGAVLILTGAAWPAFASPEIGSSCTDVCCPSTRTNSAGGTSIHIPPAAIITTLGGLALIASHMGNICARCRCCEKSEALA